MLGARLLIGGVIVAAVSTTIALAYRHHAGVVAEARQLAGDNSALRTTLDVEREVTAVLRESIDAHREAAARLEMDLELARQAEERARSETRRLNELYAGHDLRALALARPGLIARRVNAGTARVGRMLECASGSGPDGCGDRLAAGEARPPAP